MNDTPKNIKALQLQTWLSKPPMERLKQAMEDNAALFEFWAKTAPLTSTEDHGKANRVANGKKNN